MQHEGVHGNSFECPICSFLASTKQSLGSHVAMHDDDKRELRITRAECSYLERYGVTAPALSPEIREKQRQTMLDRYGVSTPLNLPESREKAIKNAWTSEARKKRNKTNINRYDEEHVLTGDSIQEKSRRALQAHCEFGNPFQIPIIQERIKRTLRIRYGVDNPIQSPLIRDKVRRTCLKHFGVDYGFMKAVVGTGRVKGRKSEVINKSGKKIHCDSSYEDRFCKCLLSDSLVEDFDRGERIRLIGQDHWYYPDFLVTLTDGRKELVEIKGSFTIKDPSVPFKIEAALAWCEENDARFSLVMEDELEQYERLVGTDQSMFEIDH